MSGLSDFDLLTVDEVAEVLHCSKAHVSNVMAGRVANCSPIPTVHLGRRKLVRRATLATWINDNEYAQENDNLKTSPERGRKSA